MKDFHIQDICAKRVRAKRKGPRGSLTPAIRKAIRAKTGGTCHVCGDRLGKRWQADHVVPWHLGGKRTTDNYLPICRECNGLRWSHEPKVLRLIMRMGVYAKNAIRHNTPLGREMLRVLRRRTGSNRKRRAG
jgi:5-methylcytosine-specific restriction endonuclease McrA